MNEFDKKIEDVLKFFKPAKTPEELTKKFSKETGESKEKIKKIIDNDLKRGEKVEKEHTTHDKIAKTIARHHEEEKLNYYKDLAKVEKK